MIAGATLFRAPLFDVALQAVVQGVLTAIVALLLYGRMVSILDATSGAAFVALTRAITAVLAIPVLRESPSVTDWMAITLISLGVYLVSGGPLPLGGHDGAMSPAHFATSAPAFATWPS
jgi:drug/metabolite transporter (DMT)-like permease